MTSTISRRRLLGLGIGVGLTATAAAAAVVMSRTWEGDDQKMVCVSQSSLPVFSQIAGAELRYEVDQQPRRAWIDQVLADRLTQWGRFLPSLGLEPVTALRTYGSWIDGGTTCTSMHHAGRAFDVAAVVAGARVISCRTDQWPGGGNDDQLAAYWRLAAGLHAYFAYVLTYLLDELHVNHIHVDDTESRFRMTSFNHRSRVQCQAVQAICRCVWKTPTELTGAWDDQTRASLAKVTDQLGLSNQIQRQPAWQDFLMASARF